MATDVNERRDTRVLRHRPVRRGRAWHDAALGDEEPLGLPPKRGVFFDLHTFGEDLRVQRGARPETEWRIAGQHQAPSLVRQQGEVRERGRCGVVRVVAPSTSAPSELLDARGAGDVRVLVASGGMLESNIPPDMIIIPNRALYKLVFDEKEHVPAGAVRFDNRDLIHGWAAFAYRLYRAGLSVGAHLDRSLSGGQHSLLHREDLG